MTRPILPLPLLFLLLTLAVPAAAAPTLDEIQAVLASRRHVDLTHAFDAATPVWRGFGPATLGAAADPETHQPYTIEQHGFRTTLYTLVGQYGTHIDPPAHFDPEGRTMDAIPLEEMLLPLVVFDVTPLLASDPDHALTVADVEAWEARHGRVPAGAFAALRTDMSKDFSTDPERFKRYPFPGWSLAAIRFLFEQRGITAIGHEALDTDATEDFAGETWLLKNGHWQIEVMTNLDQVPPRGSLIAVSWPKVKGGFGFPARAYAILP
ncbi:MAG: cyclase family protein [Gammaproteobacteria bacterium]|nr:cyclase family protein [Gammaproteobacteria bacterium]